MASKSHPLAVLIVIALVASAIQMVARAETLVLESTDDMYTDPEHPGSHAESELWVANYTGAGEFQRIMIRFDLSDIEAPAVSEATLNLFRFFVCPADPYTITDIYAISEPWSEETWPGHQHIAYDPEVWTTMAFGPQNPAWYNVDITSLVQAWVNGDIENYGLVIIARNGEKWSKFYSSEHVNPALRPYLDVEYTSTSVEDPPIEVPSLADVADVLGLRCLTPAASGMTFHYVLPGSGPVAVTIHDGSGRCIRELAAGTQAPGTHELRWDGCDGRGVPVPSGVYHCAVRTWFGTGTRKAVLLR